jgi:SAM-dependent methyltransferase
MSGTGTEAARAALWHDIECGAYEGDLALWRELSGAVDGPILDLGCGTGRVSLDLARRGRTMKGLDLDPDLVAAFNERAAGAGLPAGAAVGDARAFDLDGRFAMVLAPMQLIQLLESAVDRIDCLRCAARHLGAGGTVAVAIVDGFPAELTEETPPHLPDVREVDGWIYSSLPLDAGLDAGSIVVRRLRQTVSPAGELGEELDEIPLRLLTAETIEEEAREAGLMPAGRRHIAPTESHVGSTVVLLAGGA